MKHPNPLLLSAPYWICDACAKERGGVTFKTGNTVMADKCEYCDGEKQVGEWVTPTVDFRWPRKVHYEDPKT